MDNPRQETINEIQEVINKLGRLQERPNQEVLNWISALDELKLDIRLATPAEFEQIYTPQWNALSEMFHALLW